MTALASLLWVGVVACASCSPVSTADRDARELADALDLRRQVAMIVAEPAAPGSKAETEEILHRRRTAFYGEAAGVLWLHGGDPEAIEELYRASRSGALLLTATDERGRSASYSAPASPSTGERLDQRQFFQPAGQTTAPEPTPADSGDPTSPTGEAVEPWANIVDGAVFEASVVRPLARQLGEGVVAIELGTEHLPALADAESPMAALSPELVRGILRRDLGWDGLVVVNLAEIGLGEPEIEVAVRALTAGADVLIPRSDPALLANQLVTAVRSGELLETRTRESARRVVRTSLAAADADAPVGVRRLGDLLSPALRVPAEGAAGELIRAAPADVGMSQAAFLAIGRTIREAIQDSVMSAAALAVGRRGSLVWLEGFGRVGRDSVAVDPRTTLFDLASLSKVVGTTSAAAILVEQGRLELDQPVQHYLPAFTGGDKAAVTVRNLLTHTSGLPAGIWLYGRASSREEAISQVVGLDLARPPGEEMEYSDLGMILLAHIVEEVSGMSLDRFLAENVFSPLAMRHTMYLPPLSLHDRTVPTAISTERSYPIQGVVHDGNAFRLAGVGGHAGLFSTARDLAVFSQMMLNGGSYGETKLFSPSLVDEFTTPQPGAEERAIGWDTPADRSSAGRYFSAASYGHTGFTGTSIWIDPDRELFVVLLTNRTFTEATTGDVFDLRREVHEAVARAITDAPINRRAGAR